MSHDETSREALILRVVYAAARKMGEVLVETSAFVSEEYGVDNTTVRSRILTEFQSLVRRRRNPVYRYLGTGERGILRTRMAGRDRAAAQIYGEELFRKRFGREAGESRIEEEEED